MRKQLQLGLVVEGSSTDSAILRLPKIAEELGPIKSAASRVARRLSNALRAGYAVREYEDLQAARLILLRAPDAAISRIVSELYESELVLDSLSFVLCESWLTTDVLEPLQSRGASVATLVCVPGCKRDWYIVEGQTAAVRQIRRIIEQDGASTLELHAGMKSLCFAAELLATALPVPLYIAAQQALRASGISGNHLYAVIDEMAQGMFRDLLKGARAAWGGPLTKCSAETANGHLEALRRSHPQIADIVDEQLAWARKRMLKAPEIEEAQDTLE